MAAVLPLRILWPSLWREDIFWNIRQVLLFVWLQSASVELLCWMIWAWKKKLMRLYTLHVQVFTKWSSQNSACLRWHVPEPSQFRSYPRIWKGLLKINAPILSYKPPWKRLLLQAKATRCEELFHRLAIALADHLLACSVDHRGTAQFQGQEEHFCAGMTYISHSRSWLRHGFRIDKEDCIPSSK